MEYLIHLGVLFAIYAILSISLNLVVGYTGLLSGAHAAFYGIGAYSVAILTTNYGVNFFIAIILGVVLASLISFLIGLVLSRFRDDYYALVSLGFSAICFSIFLNWQELTRGPLGIPGISRPELFGFNFNINFLFLILSALFCLFVYLVVYFIVNSSFGRTLKAIREDEEAIRVFGYNTVYYKLIIFIISAGLASIAGGLFASYITFIDPSSFYLMESIFILSVVILGGLSSIKGSFWGALIMILLPEFLRFIGMPDSVAAQMRQVIYGTILIILMFYRPQGLFGEYKL